MAYAFNEDKSKAKLGISLYDVAYRIGNRLIKASDSSQTILLLKVDLNDIKDYLQVSESVPSPNKTYAKFLLSQYAGLEPITIEYNQINLYVKKSDGLVYSGSECLQDGESHSNLASFGTMKPFYVKEGINSGIAERFYLSSIECSVNASGIMELGYKFRSGWMRNSPTGSWTAINQISPFYATGGLYFMDILLVSI